MNRLFYIKLSPNAYIKPTMGVMLLFMALFFVLNLKKQKKLKTRKYTWLIRMIILDASIGIALSNDKITSMSVWLNLCFPMILSLMIVKYCRKNDLNFGKILEEMPKWFALYTTLMLVYFMLFRGVLTDSSVRFNPRGGGSVIFGYTIAIVFALTLCVKEHIQPKIFYLILISLTIAALATGSRGAVWPIALMWILDFLFARLTPKKMIIVLFLACAALFLSIIDIGSIIHDFSLTNGNMFARLFRTGSGERENTFQNALSIVANMDTINGMFGFGTGGLFPIQRWELQGGDMSNHYFSILGKSLLVQPHNTFIYALMENGWVGFFLWMFLILYICRLLIKNKNDNYIYQLIFVGVVVFVNLFDSIMFIQPGVATVIWLLLWCVCEQSQQDMERKILWQRILYDKQFY